MGIHARARHACAGRGVVRAVLALLLPLALLAPAGAAAAPAPDRATERAARMGTLVVTIRTPAGVPATVKLVSSRSSRLVTKGVTGTTRTVRLKVRPGVWNVRPQQLVHESRLYVGSAKAKQVRVRSGRQTATTVTYRAAPAVRDLQVTRIAPDSLDLGWTGPATTAEYAVRRAPGEEAPASATAGTEVPVSDATATATGLDAGSPYSFSVFAREPGSTRWWGPVSTTVVTPSLSTPDEPSTTVVTNPASVVVTDPRDVDAAVVAAGVAATVPAGTTPTPGQPWVLPPSADLPGGFVGTVSRVEPDGRTVVLEQGGLADAFDYLDIDVPDLSGLPTRNLGPATRIHPRVPLDCGGSVEQDIVVDPSLDPFGHFRAKLRKYKVIGKNVPVGMSFDARFGIDVGVKADVSVTAGASCQLDLPPIAATIPAGPVPIVMMTEPVLSMGLSGTIGARNVGFTASLGAEVDGYLGLGGEDEVDGELIASAEPLDPTIEEFTGAVTVTAGADTSVGPGVGNPRSGAMVGLTANLNALEADFTTAGGPTCVEIAARRSASISLEAKAWLGSWDFSRSVSVPGLDGGEDYTGSPWRLPAGCSGDADYRIAEGTVDVTSSWSGGCSNEQGSCDDGPDYTSSLTFSESSSAHLVVHEPGPWVSQWDAQTAYLSAPMRFRSWDYDASRTWRQSGWGCSWSDTYETTGPVEFGSAYWESGASVVPLPDQGLDARLNSYYYWYEEWPEEWTDSWWGGLGAWDTDHGNGYPRVPTRQSWSSGGNCTGSDQWDGHLGLDWIGPGYFWNWPEQSRRSSSESTSTLLGECTPESCRWRVDGTDTYEYRSTYARSGVQGSGTATVTWSYVIERRPLGAGQPLT